MLKRENYTSEHIDALRKQTGADPSILERTVFAFGLLEALCRVKMPFIFKGGTSLLILLDEPRRLNTDIDIIVAPSTDVDQRGSGFAKDPHGDSSLMAHASPSPFLLSTFPQAIACRHRCSGSIFGAVLQ